MRTQRVLSVLRRLCAALVAPKLISEISIQARKSSRKRTQQDYANLNSGLQSDPSRWMRLLDSKIVAEANFKRMHGSGVSLNWLNSDDSAMREPIIIESPDGLGMKMPPPTFTVRDVAEIVGEDAPVEVIGKESLVLPIVYIVHPFQMLHPNPTLRDGLWASGWNTMNRNFLNATKSGTSFHSKYLGPSWVTKFFRLALSVTWTGWRISGLVEAKARDSIQRSSSTA